jgi:effector-binding domain-containing protein
MSYVIEVCEVAARPLAAVRARVPGSAFREHLDKVWAFLRRTPGLRTDGHNVFVYHHGSGDVDFGVEVVRAFPADGDVRATTTPAGSAAVVVHRGGYDRLGDAHATMQAWLREHGHTSATSWEIYGDPTPDPADTVTTIYYLLG